MPRSARCWIAWLSSAALILLAAPAPTAAQEARPKESKPEKGGKDGDKDRPSYEIQVLAVQATRKTSETPDELKGITKVLKDALPGYTGFKVLKKLTGTTKEGDAFKGDLGSGFKIAVTPEGRSDDMRKLRVRITQPPDKDKDKGRGKPSERETLIEIKSGTSQPYSFIHPDDKEDRFVILVSAK